MRIAIDTLFEHPERPSSAIDYLKSLARDLPRIGPQHSYHLLVSPRNRHHFRDIQHPNMHFLNCHVSNENVPLRIGVQQTLLPLRMARHHLDVLFSPGNVCPLLGDFCRVLKINTLHHYHTPELIGWTRALYRRVAFYRSAHKADRIIANTEATKRELCQLMGVPESKVAVIPEALYDVFRPTPPEQTRELRARYGLERDYVLFVSTLYPYKNPESLIRSFAALVRKNGLDSELVIVGRDYDACQARLVRLAESEGILARTHFLGFVPTEDLPPFYSGARVFVYPSLVETFGKPLVEAMRCGVPVVASNRSSIPEVVGDAALLVDPMDVEALAQAIQRAATDTELREELIRRGHRRAQEFSWEVGAQQTLAVIEEAFEQRRARRGWGSSRGAGRLGVKATEERSDQLAALANLAMFDAEGTSKYVERSPHVKHESLRRLYADLALRVFTRARTHRPQPLVLDLGAGEGSTTRLFLKLGAGVTAVDISESQLRALADRCSQFADRLEVRQEEIAETLQRAEQLYDVVVMNSFLHHIPDYLGLIRQAVRVLSPHGQLFSFQDPVRYDTAGWFTLAFTDLAYFSWRIFQGNLKQGFKTRLRRLRGIYIPGSKEDDAEYHVTRNGVDQVAIAHLLASVGFECEIVTYFSTQNTLLQPVGEFLGVKNTFGILAQRREFTGSPA